MAPVSACERVCELVLCDGVPHCEKSNFPNDCDTCLLWLVGMLTPLLDDKRCLASFIVVSNCPTPLFNVPRDMIRRISSSSAVHSEYLQLSLDHKLFIRHAVCSRRSEN